MFLNIEYKNLLTKKECKEIADEFKELIKNNMANVEPTSPIAKSMAHIDYVDTNGSIGYLNSKKSLKYVKKIEDRILKDYDDSVKFSNTYIRKYGRGTVLVPHVDKPGLDLTLSLTVDGITNWPLCVSNIIFEDLDLSAATSPKYRKNYKKYYTNVGDGVACYGRNVVHWREQLDCQEDEYLIQIFYHWSFV